ncbi:PepSY-associated TM helix domain-containing protein [candidate division KSB1 bacterium]
MNWRRLNNIVHRDVGYFCVGLTIIYCISGIAVNHTHEWNPNFRITHIDMQTDPIDESELESVDTYRAVIRKLNIDDEFMNVFRPSPDKVKIFMQNGNILLDIHTGEAVYEKVLSRTILREMNYLHLNKPRSLWTWAADAYAAALLLLAVTGMFVLKGKTGIKGRGKWLIGAGVIFPIVFIFAYL